MAQLLAIALGGSLGAVTRFLAANSVSGWLGREFPHGTLFVNVFGSFLMGLLSELLLLRFAVAAEYQAAVLVGFLGAFTTFSTFALETLRLYQLPVEAAIVPPLPANPGIVPLETAPGSGPKP